MSHYHAVVWIDHREARVYHFSPTDADKQVIHADKPVKQVHHRAGPAGPGHAGADQEFLHAVAQAISDAGAVLITGPGNAKNELMKHIENHDAPLKKLIAGVETVDHPSDGQLVAHARKYFKAEDRMTR